MESRIIRLIISIILIGSMLITNPVSVFAADIVEDFKGWGFVDGTPALSGGVYTYGSWKFIAKNDGVAANDGAIETWGGDFACLSITIGPGKEVDELHILNSNGDEFNFGGFNFTGSSVHSMFVTGWRDGIQVTEKQFINYSESTLDEYFDMRSKDSEFKNVDEIRICGADLGGGDFDKISGFLESLTYDVTPVDEVPPIILGLTMTSDNANVTTVAKVGDQITLNITTNENIQSPTVTIAGQTAIVNDAGDGDAKTWKATYIMQESDTEGTIPFTLNFKDIVNNEAMQMTAVTAGSPVIFDKTAPTAPTAVTVTPIGGTVIANSLNKSNTNMTATATITAADVTGGKAELYLSDTLIASDTSITSGDTQVTFNLGTNNNAELQAAVALGGIVSVKLYDMAGNTSISSISNPTLTVDYISEIPAPPTAIVQPITGTLEVGETLTGHYTYSDVNGDLEGTSIYKWYSSDNMAGLNKTVIAGAITKTYVLTSTDIGKYISFEVTPVAATGIAQGIAVESARTGPVVLAEAVPTATVKAITGILQVGETLTGNYTYSDVNGDLEGASIYKWYRADNSAGFNKTEIAGANAKTYVLTSSDEGKYIGFEVTPVALTGIEQGTAVLSAWTGAIVPAEATPTAKVQPITGILQVGKTLTGHYTYSDVNGDLEGTSTYKWYRADYSSGLNKTEIAGANTKTYVLTSSDEGKYISFEVTPVAATGITQGIAVESGRIGQVAVDLAEAAPTATVQAITGILKVGEKLTGHYTYSDINGDLEGTSTYKWYRADNAAGLNKTAIEGATSITYVLTSADEGKYISFEVTPVAATGIAQGIAIESVRTGVVGKKAGQSGGGGGGSSYSPNPVITPTIDILINNDKVNYATSEIKMENGRKKTTIQLDDEKLTAKLSKEKDGSIITIPVNNNSDIVIAQLNAQAVKNMQDKNATLEIKTENAIYTIPVVDINIDSILENIGSQVQLKDIKISIIVSNAPEETITRVENSARSNNMQVLVNPIDFEITCTNGSKTVDVSKFNNYVERTVLLPEGVDQNKITTGVVLNKDGTFTHVPTIVKYVDERYYAKINSLTNSTYTVIWNPVTFKDVEKHWSKNYVNDVGSRLIDDGVGNGNFDPNRAITRAEFASMVVKALGLKGTNFPEKFGDVNKGDSYYYSIYTAYEYGILAGYSNGNFGPQDLITREQAMTMLAKAMEIVDLNVTVSDADMSNQLKLFKDSDSISLYARQAATICVKNGIFAGDNKGKLTPKDNLTRAESATIIIKLLKKAELI